MGTIIQLSDGTVFDHIAEFIYFPKTYLDELYKEDRVGYIDAINKILQLITTSDKIAFPRHIRKEETIRLKEELCQDGIVEDSNLDNDSNLLTLKHKHAMKWVTENWNEIDNALHTDTLMFNAMQGFVKREFIQCFLLPKAKRLDMSHYVLSEEKQTLSEFNINNLFAAVRSTPDFDNANMTLEEIIDWLNRMVTTHYKTYAEYVFSSLHHYTPAITRSHLPIRPLPQEDDFETVTRCIAIDILDKVKDRSEIVKRAVEWCHTEKGQEIIKGFSELTEAYNISTSSKEKEKVIEYVNGILEAEKGYNIGLLTGTLSVFKDVSTLKDPKGSDAMKMPSRLLWLYKIRKKDVTYTLMNRVDKLIKK